jgi:AcrR family transcriptional regulator
MSRSTYTVKGSPRLTDEKAARLEIENLWGLEKPSQPGPKSAFTARGVARAAITLADQSGLAALTMREIAKHMNTSAMTLYGRVSGKAELISLMVDEVAGECAGETEGPWNERAISLAWSNWRCFERHPWLLTVDQHRPVLGPGVLRKYEVELAAFDDLHLADVARDLALGSLLALVHGCAKGSIDAATSVARTGLTDAEWWATRAPLLEGLNLHEQFPLGSRVGAAAGAHANAPKSQAELFQFALKVWVAGMERAAFSG